MNSIPEQAVRYAAEKMGWEPRHENWLGAYFEAPDSDFYAYVTWEHEGVSGFVVPPVVRFRDIHTPPEARLASEFLRHIAEWEGE